MTTSSDCLRPDIVYTSCPEVLINNILSHSQKCPGWSMYNIITLSLKKVSWFYPVFISILEAILGKPVSLSKVTK